MAYTPEQILSWARSAPLAPAPYATLKRQRLALLVLASYGPDPAGRIRGSRVEDMRRVMAIDESGLKRTFAELERAGLVVVERDRRGHHVGYKLVGLSTVAVARAS